MPQSPTNSRFRATLRHRMDPNRGMNRRNPGLKGTGTKQGECGLSDLGKRQSKLQLEGAEAFRPREKQGGYAGLCSQIELPPDLRRNSCPRSTMKDVEASRRIPARRWDGGPLPPLQNLRLSTANLQKMTRFCETGLSLVRQASYAGSASNHSARSV